MHAAALQRLGAAAGAGAVSVGGAALAGSLLVAAGAVMPWLSIYAGLEVYRGTAGLNGRVLLAGGIAGAAAGLVYLVRPAPRLRWAIGLLGALLFGFCCWIVVQLLALYREVGGNPFVVGRLGYGLFVSTVGAAVVLSTFLLPVEPGRERVQPREDALVALLAVASGGGALIHFAVLGEHLREYWLFAFFFASAGFCQVLWALLVLWWPSRPILIAGAVGNALIVLLWIASRTHGLPFGPDAGSAEPVGVADVVATVYELLVVAGCVTLTTRMLRLRREARLVLWVLGAALVPLTIVAVLDAVQAPGIAV
jgi:hypothetical protein